MVYMLGILQFVIIMGICIYEFKNKSSVVFLWATLLLMFGFMHMIITFMGDYYYENDILNYASLFVILFCIIYLLTRIIFGSKIYKKNRNLNIISIIRKNLQNEYNYDKFFLIILVFCIYFKLSPYLKFSGNILNSSWGLGRQYTSNLGYFSILKITNFILYCIYGLIGISYIRKDKKIFIIASTLILFEVILTRNRMEILPLMCSLICIYIFKNKKIKFKTFLSVLVLSIIIIYIVYGLRVFRHYGTISNFILNFKFSEFNDKIILYLKTSDGEMGLLRDFYHFIYYRNDFDGFGKLASYIRMFLVYIPQKFSFGIKPQDFAIVMGAAVGMDAGGSTHPTLFGDCYANAGFLGIFLGGFWAIYATFMDKITIKRKTETFKLLLFFLNSSIYCIIGRGSVYNSFVFIAYGTPFLILFESVIIKFKFYIKRT